MHDSQSSTPFGDVQHARPLPVIVLADVSGSMAPQPGTPVSESKIGVLNRAVASMIRSFAAEDSLYGEITVAVIAFGGEARLHQVPTPASQATWSDMSASGRTPLGGALDLVRELLEDESAVPKRAFHPTLVLVSDGIPTDDWEGPLERLLSSPRAARAVRLAVAVGTEAGNASYQVLQRFVANPAIPVIRADEVNKLADFFQWVTMSVTMRAHSATPNDVSVFLSEELGDLVD